MFWENFYKLCQAAEKKPFVVVKEIGIAQGSITKWKNGSIPKGETLTRIADYFGVSVDFMLYGSETSAINFTSEAVPLDQANLRMVPLYESVAAGFGAYASEDIQDYMPVYFHNPADAEQTLCIKVKGHSMTPMIGDGDIIQVHKQEYVDSGSIAVVMVDGTDGLVKVVDLNQQGVELRSLNPLFPTKHFHGKDATRVRVVGLVTQVIKGVNGRKVHGVRGADDKKELMDALDKMDDQQLRELNKKLNDILKAKEK